MSAEEERTDSLPESSAPACSHCGQSISHIEGKVPLCAPCRSQFIRYPIPKWIKAFGLGILALMIVGMVSMPRQLRTGIHLHRGMLDAADHRFLTPEKELKQVADSEPHYIEAQCRLLMAAFYNNDLNTALSCYDKVAHEKIDDHELFVDVTKVLDQVETYLPKDSFMALEAQKPEGLTRNDYSDYFFHYPHDAYALFKFANLLFDQKNFVAADSALNEVLRDNPDHYPSLALKVSLKREQHQYDSSYYFADRMLALNKENAFALSTKARTLLKQHKDKEAFELNQQSLALNPTLDYGLASMALIYHFRNEIQKRDALIARAQKDSSLMPMFIYVNDIVSGKEKFRD